MTVGLLLIAAAFCGAVISGLVGMAGGIILLGVMTFFLPMTTLVPIHGVVQLVSNFSRAAVLRPHIHIPIFKAFVIGTPLGGLLGYGLLKIISNTEWLLIFVLALILYTVFKPKKLPDIRLPVWAYGILGFAAGALGLLVGATGPFLAPFFIRHDLEKEEIVATKAACQICIHLVKLPVFFVLDFPYLDYLPLIAGMMIAVIVGTKVGTGLLKKLDGKRFFTFVRVAMFVIALRLTYKIMLMFL